MTKAAKNRTYTKLLGVVIARYCGNGNAMRFEDAAERAGCSASLLRQLARGNSEVGVGFDRAMEIVKALPDEAATEFFAGLGFTGLARIDRVPGCFRKLHTAASRLTHRLAQMFEDNRIDHHEEAELQTKDLPMMQAVLSRCLRRTSA